ncbi:MAG: UDP-3-O-(3-hydroxymyristoyl)glucosamine N-acyltransferase [Acidobacteria bacterium]|nr:UDP-3-O-(3-hydroxymyristoyl)glucosamine N-acyltransferase [Acidobacteriota bacterium]
MTLAELADRLGCRLEGDGAIDVSRVAAIDDAGPGDVTFVTHRKYAAKLPATRAAAAIVDDTIDRAPCALLRARHPAVAVADAVALLMPPRRPAPGISPLAAIDPTAEIGAAVSIGPFVVIGARARVGSRTILEPHVVIGDDAIVGDDCLFHAHVSVRGRVEIGNRVVLQDAAVIGSDGFGFARRPDGTHQKIPQVGRVVIEDDVEIGAHTAVDRPAIGETRVGRGTKVDNLVQIAHGVRIGRNVLMAAQSGVAGSTWLGDDVVMAGQSGAAGHLHVGRGVVVSAKSVVTKDIDAGHHVAGIPAGDVGEWREEVVLIRRLPELRQTVADLDARLAAIEAKLMT